jgi:hypothetical protein
LPSWFASHSVDLSQRLDGELAMTCSGSVDRDLGRSGRNVQRPAPR